MSCAIETYTGFERLTSQKDCRDSCSFDYNGIAMITVINSYYLTINADEERKLNTAETRIKKICTDKGVPLVDLTI